uniref:Uncharacterized protein n=1 Tax=Rhizophagus irregularis (strain DAOM 181602 / DAOM 197198 / MUCL 43194) TaxID=747089 RepID=U9UAH7_RHIID
MVLSVIDFENMQQLQEHLNLKFKYIEHIKLLLTRMQWLSFNLKGITDIAILTKGYSGCMGQERIRCSDVANFNDLVDEMPEVEIKSKMIEQYLQEVFVNSTSYKQFEMSNVTSYYV